MKDMQCIEIPEEREILITGSDPSSLSTEENPYIWVHFELSGSNERQPFRSHLLIPQSVQYTEQHKRIRQHIANRGGLAHFPSIKSLQDDVRRWIIECWESDNEMWFVSAEEYFEHEIAHRLHDIRCCIEEWRLYDTVVQEFDPATDDPNHYESLFTIYGGSASLVNWHNAEEGVR